MEGPLLAAIFAFLGLIWVVVGILACLKKISAVRVGLVLSYVSVIGNLTNVNIITIVVLIVVIIQAHRVLAFAKKMNAADVPLDVKP
jgi:hypothetical protein